jgi:hypothetical protein
MAELKIWVLTDEEPDYSSEVEELGYFQSLEGAQAAAVQYVADETKWDRTDWTDSYEERQVKASFGIPSPETPVYDRENLKWLARRMVRFTADGQEPYADPSEQRLMIANRHKRAYEPTGYVAKQYEVLP